MLRSRTGLCRKFSRVVLAALFCAAWGAGLPPVMASKSDLMSVVHDQKKKDPILYLTQGMAEVVDIKGTISDVMVANPATVDVTAIQSNRLYVVGLNLGSTNVIVLDEKGDVISRLVVHVKIDEGPIQRLVDELFPKEDVTVHALEQQVILTGKVSTADVANRIFNMVGHYVGDITEMDGSMDEIISNQLEVAGKSQVMLRVRVVEIARTLLREIGNNTDIEDFGGILGNNIRPNPAVGAMIGTVATGISEIPIASGGAITTLGAFGPITTAITLLEREGLARILAEPNLTAISGEQAGFLAGGEFPVPSGRDQDGNIVITYRQFGVSLNFRPVVLSEERIGLQLDTEVSSLSRETIVQLDGIDVPGLDVRRATTTVELGSGGTLMIAGLLQSQTLRNMSQLPGIGSVPILGDLMASDGFRREETEMVVLVSPYLVEPFADDKQAKHVPLPDEPARKTTKALAAAFESNIRRAYGKLSLTGLFDGDGRYGYIME